VSAELYVDSNDYVKPGQGQGSEVEDNVKMKVKLSIPACYAMDVYVAPQDNSTAVAGSLLCICRISSACYDKQQACVYMQPFSC